MIWVEIEFPNYKVLLCVVYRSLGLPNGFGKISNILSRKHLIIQQTSLLREIWILIHEPTRIYQNTGNGTLLDPVLISADCNVTFSEVIDVCREKSDHNATKISLQIPNYLQKRTSEQYGCIRMQTLNNLIN